MGKFILGVLIGMIVWIKANPVLGVIVGIIVTVGGFFAIRAFENILYKGAEAAEQSIKTAINNKKAEKAQQSQINASNGIICPQCGAKQNSDAVFCRNCGTKLN